MPDNPAEHALGGIAASTLPSGQSETQLRTSPTVFFGEEPQNAIDGETSTSGWDALDLFLPESDAAVGERRCAQTGGEAPALQPCTESTPQLSSGDRHQAPTTELAASENVHTQLRQADLTLNQLSEEANALKRELTPLRDLAAQLTSDYSAIHRVACEAQECSAAAAHDADVIQQRLASLAVLQDLGRHIDERFGVLNTLTQEVTVRTSILQAQKDTIECALLDAGRVADMVRAMEARVANLQEGNQLIAQKEAILRQMEQIAIETTEHLEQREQLGDEVGRQLARFEREVQALIESARSDVEALVIEKKVFMFNSHLSAPQAFFHECPATMGDADLRAEHRQGVPLSSDEELRWMPRMDVNRASRWSSQGRRWTHMATRLPPQSTMRRILYAGGVVGAWLLIALISFLVTRPLVRSAQVGDERLPVPDTSVPLPSQNLRSAVPASRPAPVLPPRPPLAGGPRPEFTGRLAVQSVPGGADVFINRRHVGTTPLRMPRLRAGSYVVWIERQGFRRWTSAVQVAADTPTRVTARLEPDGR